MNNISINSKKILSFKSAQEQVAQYRQSNLEQTQLPVELPQIYNITPESDKKEVKDKIKRFDFMGLITPWFEHPLLSLGVASGMAIGIDKFAQACGGAYETSIVGKAENLGNKIEHSKIVQSTPVQSSLNGVKKVKNKIVKITEKSPLITAFRKTPSLPEWQTPKLEMLTMEQHVVHDFSQIIRGMKLTTPEDVSLAELGLSKNDKIFLNNFFKNAKATEETMSNAVQLKRIGLTDDVIRDTISKPDATLLTKQFQLEKMGVTPEFLQKLETNPASKEDLIKIREACKNAKGIQISEGNIRMFGKFQPLSRKMNLEEISNRLVSMGEAKTKTGQALATFLQKCYRGLTFGNGKMGVIFWVTPFLVYSLVNVKKADKNEKAGTLAEGIIHSISWVFTFPLALKLMHKFGGMQYAGMSQEKIEECRKLINEFNKKANPYMEDKWYNVFGFGGDKKPIDQTFKTHQEYKAAKDIVKNKLKELKTVKDQNLFTKIGRKIGSFLTMDLEILKSYRGGSVPGNITRNIPNFLKNLAGVPMRIAIWGAISIGLFDTIINKCIKTCFGNSYDQALEEETIEAKKAQKKFTQEDLRKRLLEAQAEKIYGNNNNVNESKKLDDKPDLYQAQLVEKIKTRMNIPENSKIENEEPKFVAEKDSILISEDVGTTSDSGLISKKMSVEVPEPQIKSFNDKKTIDELNYNNILLQEDNGNDTVVAESIEDYENDSFGLIHEGSSLEEDSYNEDTLVKTSGFVAESASQVEEKQEALVNTENSENKDSAEQEDMKLDNYAYIPSSEPVNS
ncbi:hypothetical protein IKB17_01210, partial [bacterium]|nr:hypothetical protein [bacterium]